MDSLWINKYRPTNLDEVVGNKFQIKKFKNWLTNLQNLKNQSIIISGNSGIGKSLIIKLILENFNYSVRIIYPNEIKDHRTFDDFYDYFNHKNSIYSKINFKNNFNNKLAIIFDETENISLISEKNMLLKFLNKTIKQNHSP
jgi:replication factor C subunit 1